MQFCLDDGSPLVAEPERNLGANADATLHLPGHSTEQPPTIRSTQPSTIRSNQQSTIGAVGAGAGPIAAETMAGANGNRRSRSLLWVMLALIIGGSGIAIALIVTRARQPDTASSSQTGTSTAPPSPSPNIVESSSPTIDSKGAPNAPVKEEVKPEKPTPLPKVTPLTKPTPAKADVREEQPSPPSRPPPQAPISGGVLNGKAVRLVQPSYPAIARTAHVSGTVTVQVTIDESGNVISAHATSGHPLLQSSAVAAARASKFSPTKLSGQPVKVSGVIIYNFQAQ